MKFFLWALFVIGFGSFLIGVVGGVREPFIASDAVREICCEWIPIILVAFCLFVRFSPMFNPDYSFKRFISERGAVGGLSALFLASFLFVAAAAGMGAIGWSRAAGYATPLLKSVSFEREAIYLRMGGVTRSNFSPLVSVDIQFSGGNETNSFAWPQSAAADFSRCPKNKIVLSGKESVVGMVVEKITCGSSGSSGVD